MIEAVTVTLSPELIRKLDELRLEEDADYEDVISRVIEYFMDADNYVTEEECEEILANIAEGKEKGSYSSENIRALIDQSAD